MLFQIQKILFAAVLLSVSSVSNAFQLQFVQHNLTSENGTVSTMIMDGSNALAGAFWLFGSALGRAGWLRRNTAKRI